MSLIARTLLVLMLAAAVVPGSAWAQDTTRSSIPAKTLIEAARAALAVGALGDAETLLKGVNA